MSERQAVIAFDKDERARIQAALQAYMQRHAIGTPTLQVRIIKADAPRHREIPLSTLQRFLTGSHRTTDAYVGLCAQFIGSASLPLDGNDPEFGAALSGFLRPPGQTGSAAPSMPETLKRALEGRYHRVMGREDAAELPALDIEITSLSGQPYMHVQETQKMPTGDGARYKFEGTLVTSGLLIFLALRSVLTHLPKIYWLERLETHQRYQGIYLTGQSSETLFREDAPDGSCVINTKVMIEARR